MHELSIAIDLIEIATDLASHANIHHIERLYVQLGALSGVVPSALEGSFEIAVQGTRLEGAILVIDELPAIIYCAVCNANVPLANIQQFRCPHCETASSKLVQGREIQLVSIEYNDTPAAMASA